MNYRTWTPLRVNSLTVACLWLVAGALIATAGCQAGREPPQARFVKQIDWLSQGQWLKADLHTHTKFSDGAYSPGEVVDKAAAFACQVIAITDHSDRNLTAATPAYFDEIEAARKTHPEVLVLAGLEWNVPPHGGDEHASVYLAQSEKEGPLLAEFKAAFDDLDRAEHKTELADQALRWLAERGVAGGISPVVIYNHPNRKRDDSSQFVDELVHLRTVNNLIVGFEGGPGHQRHQPLGTYKQKQELVDRWDPAVATIGGAWDQLLAQGIDVWGAVANSDFHNDNPTDLHDFWPGEFSETWLYVPEKTSSGVLRALQAGSFFGVHGFIAREVQLCVDADGLARPAEAGETISILPGSQLRVQVKCLPSSTDWEGKPSALPTIELIAIEEAGAKQIASHTLTADSPQLQTTITPRGKFLVLRARTSRDRRRARPDVLYQSGTRNRAMTNRDEAREEQSALKGHHVKARGVELGCGLLRMR